MPANDPAALCEAEDPGSRALYGQGGEICSAGGGLAATVFTVAFAAAEAVRVNTLNLIVKVLDNKTVFEFGQEPTVDPMSQLDTGWIPDGYELVDQYSDTVGVMV